MSTKTKVALTALVFAIAGFLLNPSSPLGRAVWGPTPQGPTPARAQLGLLMAVGLFEAAAFGLGMAFLLFGRPFLARLFADSRRALAAHLALAWGLLSWVPHSAMHRTAGFDMGRLILTEYTFHVTLIGAAALLGWVLVAEGRARATHAAPRPAGAASFTLVAPRPSVARPPR